MFTGTEFAHLILSEHWKGAVIKAQKDNWINTITRGRRCLKMQCYYYTRNFQYLNKTGSKHPIYAKKGPTGTGTFNTSNHSAPQMVFMWNTCHNSNQAVNQIKRLHNSSTTAGADARCSAQHLIHLQETSRAQYNQLTATIPLPANYIKDYSHCWWDTTYGDNPTTQLHYTYTLSWHKCTSMRVNPCGYPFPYNC